MKTAIIYARSANANEQIEQQISICKCFAKEHEIKITGIFAYKGCSGTIKNKAGIKDLKKASKKEKFDYFLTCNSLRIGRRFDIVIDFITEFRKMGIETLIATPQQSDFCSLLPSLIQTINQTKGGKK